MNKCLATALMIFALTDVAHANEFVFTAIPDQDESQLKKRFGKVATYLSKTLNVKTKYVPVKSYAAAVTAFRNNQVQLAWFGGLSGVRARGLVKDSRAIAQGKNDPFFKTYFIAHKSTGLNFSENFLPKAFSIPSLPIMKPNSPPHVAVGLSESQPVNVPIFMVSLMFPSP